MLVYYTFFINSCFLLVYIQSDINKFDSDHIIVKIINMLLLVIYLWNSQPENNNDYIRSSIWNKDLPLKSLVKNNAYFMYQYCNYSETI